MLPIKRILLNGFRLFYYLLLIYCALALTCFPAKAVLFLPSDYEESPIIATLPPEVYPAIGNKPFAILLCRFSDSASTPHDLPFYQTAFDDIYPHIGNYWQEVSNNQLNINTSRVYGWYTLPNPASSYFDFSTNYPTGAEREKLWNACTAAADADVNYTSYYGVILVFQGWPINKGRYGDWKQKTLDGQTRIKGEVYVAASDFDSALATIEHEMGHTFSMRHSLGPDGTPYVNRWDLMSDTFHDCSDNNGEPRPSATDPVYGCLGQHPLAYHKDSVGWFAAGQKTSITPGTTKTLTITSHEQPSQNALLLATIEVANSKKIYTVESRQRVGYDRKLPKKGIILHTVEPDSFGSLEPRLIDGDGNGNLYDDGTVWVPGEKYRNEVDNITICVELATRNSFEVSLASGSDISCDVQSHLSVSNLDSSLAVHVGERITVTSIIENNSIPAEMITGTVTFPSHLTYVTNSAEIDSGSVTVKNGIATFAIGQLAFDEAAELTYVLEVPPNFNDASLENITISINWAKGNQVSTHTIAINPLLIYLPMIRK